mmetsp:Transcript_40563/g.135168  ORF Transcript_40563/g.135168 Transcript_40563/m.135168 type:complete len:215 (+) Transcript_40563:514-1158(+)
MLRSTTSSLSRTTSRVYCVSARALSFENDPLAHLLAHVGTTTGGTVPPTTEVKGKDASSRASTCCHRSPLARMWTGRVVFTRERERSNRITSRTAFPYPRRRHAAHVPTGKRMFCDWTSRLSRIAAAGAAGTLAGAAAEQSGEGTQRGMALVSSVSRRPGLGGSAAVVEQLHELESCGGSQAPLALLPSPLDRRSCHARPYEMLLRTRTGTSIL